MTAQYFDLVGVLVTHQRADHHYHIDYIYKFRIGENLDGQAKQRGFNMPLAERFDTLLHHIEMAYLPVLISSWEQTGGNVDRYFLSFVKGQDPIALALPGNWVCYCER